ncbi:hypothetical protein [Ruegeria sp.]|uniref:hypothetical protein n=1 Tax=Ruegeria sp. TaxID=1879320 RepID=UPI0023157473|nr:hypothetical protein [Ruegeria sp.]MDA7963346.1 hypothetical protein [Ruegeria sp.]
MKKFFAAPILGALLCASAAQADDLTFLLVNESTANLIEFNVSPASSARWQGNLLRGGVLAAGYEVDVLVADGLTTCIYDIRGQFGDGSVAEDYNVNLCDLGEYAFSD